MTKENPFAKAIASRYQEVEPNHPTRARLLKLERSNRPSPLKLRLEKGDDQPRENGRMMLGWDAPTTSSGKQI